MKILKIEDNKGYFWTNSEDNWKPIDQIDKDGLMALLNIYIGGNDIEMDPYGEGLIKNPAQDIIYKRIFEQFSTLAENKDKFKDEGERQYLEAIQKYKNLETDES